MGGRVSDVVFAPGTTKTFYVGYASGGLWVTKNRGTTFAPIFDGEVTSSIGSVAVCGEDGKTLWVGTGEGNGRNSSSWGNGVYRSDDAGKTWACLGLEDSHDIPRLAVDPRDPNVCYVAALGHLWGHNKTRGLYKTVDGGKNWERILGIDDKTGCCDVVLDPHDPETVYCAMYMRLRTPYSFVSGGPEGGIYRSRDGGRTWTKLSGGLPTQTGRIGLDMSSGKPGLLMAVVESTENGANTIRDDRMRGGGVFRSEDGGDSWEKLSVRSPRAFYFSKLRIDPHDDQRIYLLGWTTEISDDGGRTFREGGPNILHADHHAVIVSPEDKDHVVIGTDGGVYQSFDRGETWDFLDTMATGQFYNIALDDSVPYRVMGGLQDNGTWIGPSSGEREDPEEKSCAIPATGITNRDWKYVFWGDGFHAAFDPTDRDCVYAEWQGGNLAHINLRTGEKRYIAPEAREGEPRLRYNWNAPFFVSPHEATTLYHAGNHVFRLLERGQRWERISPDLTTKDPDKMTTVGSNAETYCTVVSLDESSLRAGILWAGSDDGLIHVTWNGGGEWQNVTPNAVTGRYVSRLVASAHEERRAYASIDGHRSDDMDPCILCTDDGGMSWHDVTGDLPKGRSVKVVREDRFNPDVLYCGTEAAVYLSVDRGQHWVKMNGKALPTTPVDDILQHPREKDIVLGTHGRSIWILDDAAPLGQLSPEVLDAALHLFPVQDCRPRWYLGHNGPWTHKAFRASNAPAGVRIWYWVRDYTGDNVKIVITDAKGVSQKEIVGSNAPGLHRVSWNLEPHEWLKMADQNEDPYMAFQVRPGTYKVKISMGSLELNGSFRVLERLG